MLFNQFLLKTGTQVNTTPIEPRDVTDATSTTNTTSDGTDSSIATNDVTPQPQDSSLVINYDNMATSDVYLFENEVIIDYPINANAFICANKVVISSEIAGDAFICANEIILEETSYIYNNLFICAKNATLGGVVCDLYAAGNNIEFTGTAHIIRDTKILANSVLFNGIIEKNAYVRSDNIKFADFAKRNLATIIDGDLYYSSSSEQSMPKEVVSGNVNFTPLTSEAKSIYTYITSLAITISSIVVIWLLALWLTPKAIKESGNLLMRNFLPIVGLGILTPIILLVTFAVLLILGFTTKISLLALLILITLCMFSSGVFVIAINNLICSKLKLEKTLQRFGILLVTSVIYWIISTLIPYISFIFTLIANITGLGIIIYNILPLPSKTNTDNKTE